MKEILIGYALALVLISLAADYAAEYRESLTLPSILEAR